MHTFLKLIFVITWTVIVAVSGYTIGRTKQGAAISTIYTPKIPSKYELLLDRQALAIKDDKGDSYILKKIDRNRCTSACTYEIFPATDAESAPGEKK